MLVLSQGEVGQDNKQVDLAKSALVKSAFLLIDLISLLIGFL